MCTDRSCSFEKACCFRIRVAIASAERTASPAPRRKTSPKHRKSLGELTSENTRSSTPAKKSSNPGTPRTSFSPIIMRGGTRSGNQSPDALSPSSSETARRRSSTSAVSGAETGRSRHVVSDEEDDDEAAFLQVARSAGRRSSQGRALISRSKSGKKSPCPR